MRVAKNGVLCNESEGNEDMTRNLKALGLALVAVFAMTAVLASAAQALKVVMPGEGESITAWLTGETVAHEGISGLLHKFTLAGGQGISCEEPTFVATVKNGNTSVTVVPTYDNCDAKIGNETLGATITMNDCDYLFHGGVEVSSTTFKEGEVDLVCPAGKVVEIHVYKDVKHNEELCTYKVAGFTNNKANEFHNEGTGATSDVKITTTATGIATTRTGSLLCGAASTTGTYTGSTTVIAKQDLGGTISNGTVSGLNDNGNQIGLAVSK